MKKYSFKYDYSEGTHPRILAALTRTNYLQQYGYSEDDYCVEAEKIIKQKVGNPDADVHFVSGGTQANLVVISSILKPYESVVAAETGHIYVHETGAIEATGHKINTISTTDGKITVEGIKMVLDEHTDEHMVKPKMVFLSNSTEVGTVYKKSELKEISEFCKKSGLFLYIDGARLGSALTATENDMTLAELSKMVDVFYIGGTKNGALLGEAIVINHKNLKENFRFHMKQKGALLAKGRIFGLIFTELLKDDLYFEIARSANEKADKIRAALKSRNYTFLTETTSNQIFPVLPNELIDKLHQKFDFYVWQKVEKKKSAVRLVTSWATSGEAVQDFIETLD